MGRDGQKDFDFLIGTWKVRNRRLCERLVGSQKWDEFDGTSVARAVWGGLANMDEYEAHAPFGLIQGLTGSWRARASSRLLKNPTLSAGSA
jgi:hypothetical protein